MSLLFLGNTNSSWSLELIREPYLQMGTTDSVTIAWRTDFAATGWVRYSTDPDNLLEKSATSPAAANQSVVIPDLEPETRYYYTIHSAAGTLSDPDENTFFETAPETGTTGPVRMWVVGDSGTGGGSQKNVRDAMLNFVGDDKIDLFLHMGDMAYGSGTNDEFTNNFYGIYSDILRNTVCWPTMGNHEGYTSNAEDEAGPYYDGYILPTQGEAGGLASGTEAYYSFDYANIHFIVLESHQSSREPGSPMLTWLEADITATDQDWIIAFWHHGPYTLGSHNSNTESRHIDMRENALPILEANGVDLVLSGHSHIYERSFLIDGAYDTPTTAEGHIIDEGDGRPGGDGPYIKSPGLNAHEGAVYVTAGHGGAGVSKEGDHPVMYFVEVKNGSCIVDVEGSRLTLINVRYDGEITDNFTIMKGDGIVLGYPIGGETIEADTTALIKWTTIGNVPFVDIDYTLNGGNLWIPLAKKLPNTGSLPWDLPYVETASARVRVQATNDPEISDESSALFKIITTISAVMIPFGDVWKYHDQNQDPGIAWNTLDFDDSTWDSGPAQLGYGDDDEATVLNDENPNVPTVYFRKTITVDNVPDNLLLSIVFDDGYAAFINGVEVARENVGSLGFIDWSTSAGSDNAISENKLGIGEDLPLEIGQNVVAVLVKQRSGTSSDVSFDGRLIAEIVQMFPNTPPDFVNPGAQVLNVDQAFSLQLEASDADNDEIVYLSSTLPEEATLDFQAGVFTWTPEQKHLGERGITFTVADLRGLSTSHSVIFSVGLNGRIPDAGTRSPDSGAPTVDEGTPQETVHSIDPGGVATDNASQPADTGSSASSGGCVASKAPMSSATSLSLFILLALALIRRRRDPTIKG